MYTVGFLLCKIIKKNLGVSEIVRTFAQIMFKIAPSHVRFPKNRVVLYIIT